MKIVKQGFFIQTPMGYSLLKQIERAARTCYKSQNVEDDISKTKMFVKMLVDKRHDAMLEHAYITVRAFTDRGVSHEIVRHRMASYAQESTRYCNYSSDRFHNEITVVMPVKFYCLDPNTEKQYQIWKEACERAEKAYFDMLNEGATPQEARAVLPHSLKSEIVMTMNIREWRHFFKLRTAKDAHPQMQDLAKQILVTFRDYQPILFDDVGVI